MSKTFELKNEGEFEFVFTVQVWYVSCARAETEIIAKSASTNKFHTISRLFVPNAWAQLEKKNK